MKRDMSLIRAILMWAIDQPHGYIYANPMLDGYTEEEVSYHVYLMDQAGLIKASVRNVISLPSPDATVQEITWEGYEFASAVRDEALWRRAGAVVLKEGASFSFGLLKRWLEAQAAGPLGL